MKFALDTSILTALSKEIPKGKHRLDRAGAVWTALCVEKRHFEMSWSKMYGFRASPLLATKM